MEANVASFEVESEEWRKLLPHQRCVAIDVTAYGRKEDFFSPKWKIVVTLFNVCILIVEDMHKALRDADLRSNQSSQRHESKGMKKGIVFEERPREAIDVSMTLKRRVLHLSRKDLLVILSR
ncbi:hypothetical protein Tco_1086192 [Tanacetum coccineum]